MIWLVPDPSVFQLITYFLALTCGKTDQSLTTNQNPPHMVLVTHSSRGVWLQVMVDVSYV